jgi:hypothetical protein
MRKIVEIMKCAGDEESGSTSRECKDIGFLGVCRKLWHFWRHNGTHLDDYDEFRIRVFNSEYDRMKYKLARLKTREESVSPEARKKALDKLLEDSNK